MTSNVTNPRQLAPTVGPAVKSVTFRAGSMKGAEDLAIGHIIMVDGTPLIDDSSWGPEADYLETGRIIPLDLFMFSSASSVARQKTHHSRATQKKESP